MRKLIAALFLITGLCGLSFAGPEPYSGKEVKQVVPPPPSCPDFGGFYGGIFGGYVRSNADLDLDLTGAWETFPEGIDAIEHEHQPGNLDNDGGELGGLLGYNFKFGNHWVLGIEAAGSYIWGRDSSASGLFAVGKSDAYELDNSFKTHYLFTVAPRIGYAFCRWMPYVTGGLAVGDLDYDWDLVNVGIRENGFGEFEQHGHDNETNIGFMVGAGVEYALTNHWHIRAQYQFVDLGDIDFHTAGTGFFNLNSNAPQQGFVPSDYTGEHEASLTEHHASVALIFQF